MVLRAKVDGERLRFFLVGSSPEGWWPVWAVPEMKERRMINNRTTHSKSEDEVCTHFSSRFRVVVCLVVVLYSILQVL